MVATRHYVSDEPALLERGREVLRLRRESVEAAARREELTRRGWREGAHLTVKNPALPTVRGAA